MSTHNPRVVPLESGDLMESPLQTMWKWHLINELAFQPGNTLEDSFVHKLIALEVLDKSHVSMASAKSNIFPGMSRSHHNPNLLLYRDLLKVRAQQRKQQDEEEASE